MTEKEFFEMVKSEGYVKAGSEAHLVMHELAQHALKITAEINNRYHTKDELLNLMRSLTEKEVDESFNMFPPFYSDCGKNIHIGKNVFINAGCKFQDQGGIYIGDGSLIGHNAVLVTINHDERVEERASMYLKAIHIGKNVWIGANVTILPGVSVGDGAIIAAGAVVSKNVPENSLVAGVPARVIKKMAG